ERGATRDAGRGRRAGVRVPAQPVRPDDQHHHRRRRRAARRPAAGPLRRAAAAL
ncbi:MAG: hypothetical protein AVDCRST_MAG89-2055, partial [uncultured Gemmatimonadetes bacterium]